MVFADFLLKFQDHSSEPVLNRVRGTSTHLTKVGNNSLTVSVSDRGKVLFQSYSGSNLQCWCFGEIHSYKREPLRHGLFVQVARDIEAGTPFDPCDLNGHCLLLAYCLRTHAWHIWVNRLGTMHAYYAMGGRSVALGTFFPAVAAAASRRQLDWLGLTGFFGFGFFPQDRTPFEDVRILRPGSHYVFGENGSLIKEERYWKWWYEPDVKRSYKDTLTDFGEVLDDVLADQTREGRIAVPISGGLDSRTTVASISKYSEPLSSNRDLWFYSYGYSDDSIETRIARQVAEARQLPFHSFTIKPYLFDRLDLVQASVEGFQDITQCRQAAVVEPMANEADYVIAAHMGDLWLDDMGLVSQGLKTLSDEDIVTYALKKLEKRGRLWLLEHLCRPRLRSCEPEALLREMVRHEMDKLQHIEHPDSRLKALKIEQWVFRLTNAGLRMYQAAAFPRLPFYDGRMIDFFCTVPCAFVSGRKLQIDYLKRVAPDLARIAWQVFDTNLYHYKYFNSLLLPKRAVKKLYRILSSRKAIERNWEVQLLSVEGRVGLQDCLVRKGLRLHDLIDPAIIGNLIDEFFSNPGAENGYAISMLLSFSTWLEGYG